MSSPSLAARFTEYFNAIRHSANPKEPLSYLPQTWRVLKARINYGVGARLYSLFDLREVDERNWPDYILDEPFKVVQRAASSPQARWIADNKLAFYNHCQKHGIFAIPVAGLMSHKSDIQNFGVLQVADAEALAKLFQEYGPSLFFKLIDGSHGRKAFVAKMVGAYFEVKGAQLTLTDFFNHCRSQIEDESGWLIQPVVSNHAGMMDYMAGGLGTVRIVSVASDRGPQLIGACLRITSGSSIVDNFAHGSSGNLAAAIHIDTGRLSSARGSTRVDWPVMRSFSNHPSKGVPIAGREIPLWRETLALVNLAHNSLPALKIIGWDVAITNSGPILVEANSTCDIDILQVTHQRGFRPLFAECQISM